MCLINFPHKLIFIVFYSCCHLVPGPVTGVTFTKVSDSEIIVTWREPEMTNGLILHYIITVTFYSTGQTVYTNMVSGGLSDMVTGLGEMHCSLG